MVVWFYNTAISVARAMKGARHLAAYDPRNKLFIVDLFLA